MTIWKQSVVASVLTLIASSCGGEGTEETVQSSTSVSVVLGTPGGQKNAKRTPVPVPGAPLEGGVRYRIREIFWGSGVDLEFTAPLGTPVSADFGPGAVGFLRGEEFLLFVTDRRDVRVLNDPLASLATAAGPAEILAMTSPLQGDALDWLGAHPYLEIGPTVELAVAGFPTRARDYTVKLLPAEAPACAPPLPAALRCIDLISEPGGFAITGQEGARLRLGAVTTPYGTLLVDFGPTFAGSEALFESLEVVGAPLPAGADGARRLETPNQTLEPSARHLADRLMPGLLGVLFDAPARPAVGRGLPGVVFVALAEAPNSFLSLFDASQLRVADEGVEPRQLSSADEFAAKSKPAPEDLI